MSKVKIGYFSKKAFEKFSRFPSIFPRGYLFMKPNGNPTIATTYIFEGENIEDHYHYDDTVSVGEIADLIRAV